MFLSIPFVPAVTTVAQQMATGLDSFAMLAIPLFVLAGQFMNRGGVAVRLVDFAKSVVGFLPGGLAIVNVLACMLFGSISGSAAAAASAIGGTMRDQMVAERYPAPFCAAVNLSSATTGLLIPPSNILIVYSLASGGVSIGALFIAGYLPGILMGTLLMLVAAGLSLYFKVPTSQFVGIKTMLRLFLRALPSLLLLLIVIGGILAGIFTATEAAGVAVAYSFLLSVVIYREVKWDELSSVVLQSVRLSSIILLLIGASMAMSWIMAYLEIPQRVSQAMLAGTESPMMVLLLINVILLFVGAFMDMTPAVLIFTPIFLPVAIELGIDPMHFGIILVMNLCIGLCTPPVGTLLFIGCSVAQTGVSETVRPLIPFFVAMLVSLVLVTMLPELSLWLPRVFGFIG
jgi:tripartite ATP-independent transporter DctM subunit